MQKNRLIGSIDLTNFNNHFIEVLLLSYIFEKQNDQLTILDLNNIEDNKYINDMIKAKKEGDLTTFKVFDRSLYQIIANSLQKENKALNLAKQIKKENQNLVLSLSLSENNLNTKLIECVKEVFIFVDINKDIQTKLVTFFMNNSVRDKIIRLVIYNYKSNINNEKELLSIRKMFAKSNVSIFTIDKIPDPKNLAELESIEPWNELYKAIKKII